MFSQEIIYYVLNNSRIMHKGIKISYETSNNKLENDFTKIDGTPIIGGIGCYAGSELELRKKLELTASKEHIKENTFDDRSSHESSYINKTFFYNNKYVYVTDVKKCGTRYGILYESWNESNNSIKTSILRLTSFSCLVPATEERMKKNNDKLKIQNKLNELDMKRRKLINYAQQQGFGMIY